MRPLRRTTMMCGDYVLLCCDCGCDAWYLAEGDRIVHEDFYVHDSLWQEACADVDDRIICIGCFERRLGRLLVRDDFKGPPHVLFGDPPSLRFQDRFNH